MTTHSSILAWRISDTSEISKSLMRGAWWATVHRVTKSRTQLKRLSVYARISFSHRFSMSEWVAPCPTLCDPMDYTVHGILQARIQEWVAFPFSRGSSQLGDRTQVSCIVGRFFLPTEPQGKSKNTGMGSLSLLQGLFPTQESNQGLCIAGRFFTNWAIREALTYNNRK